MAKLKQSFSDRLTTLREQNALSASDLAKLANVSPASVWQWEKNGTTPRSATVAAIASKLGVTPEYLLNGTEAVDLIKVVSSETAPQTGLENASLEELMRAIEAKGFVVSVSSLMK